MKENEERRTGERRNGRTGERENGRTGERENGRTGGNRRTGERENETFLNSSNTEGAVNKKWNIPVSFYPVSSGHNFSRFQYIFQEYVTITF